MNRRLALWAALALLVPSSAYAEDGEDREDAAAAAATAATVKQLADRDRDEKLAGLAAAKDDQDSSLLRPLARLIKDRDDAVRLAAIEALGARTGPDARRRAAAALNPRVAALAGREEHKAELLAVCAALHDLAQESSLRPLLDGIDAKSDPEVVAARTRAAANIPSKEVIDRLIRLAASGRRGMRFRTNACKKALEYALQEKLDGGVERWRAWWREHESEYDAADLARRRAEARKVDAEKEQRRQERAERRQARKDKSGRKNDPADAG